MAEIFEVKEEIVDLPPDYELPIEECELRELENLPTRTDETDSDVDESQKILSVILPTKVYKKHKKLTKNKNNCSPDTNSYSNPVFSYTKANPKRISKNESTKQVAINQLQNLISSSRYGSTLEHGNALTQLVNVKKRKIDLEKRAVQRYFREMAKKLKKCQCGNEVNCVNCKNMNNYESANKMKLAFFSEWDETSTLKFVQEYCKHPCLWDVEDENYNDKNIREASIQSIVEDVKIENLTLPIAKTKICSIQQIYWREVLKILNSMKGATGYIYKSNVSWFPIAHHHLKKVLWKGLESYGDPYVGEYEKNGEDESRILMMECDVSANESWDSNMEHEELALFTESESDELARTEDEALIDESKISKESLDILIEEDGIKKSLPYSMLEKEIKNELSDITTSSSRSPLAAEDDKKEIDFSLFGELLGIQLSYMPFDDAKEIKKEINRIVRRKQLEIVKRKELRVQLLRSNSAIISEIEHEHSNS